MSYTKYGSIPEEATGTTPNDTPSKSSHHAQSALLIAVSLCLVVLFMLSTGTPQPAAPEPVMGKSHHSSTSSSSAKDRILDDCGFIDVPSVSCEQAFNAPFFRDYIEFQHTVAGVDIIDLVGGRDDKNQVYELEFAGMNVSLYVAYEQDVPLTADIELVDGFDFFDAYHEHWSFQDLPAPAVLDTPSCRNVGEKQQHGKHHHLDKKASKGGCRIIHSFLGIFSTEVPVTRDEWYAAVDDEAVGLYDLLTSE